MATMSQVYDVAGAYNFNVPAGVSCVFATIMGAGASGMGKALGNGAAAWSGGAAEYCRWVPVPCTPGGTLAVIVGAGGVCDPQPNPPSAPGGLSSVGPYRVLGAPGQAWNGGIGKGGLGGGYGNGGAGDPPAFPWISPNGNREGQLYCAGSSGGSSRHDDPDTVYGGPSTGIPLGGASIPTRHGGGGGSSFFGPGGDGGAPDNDGLPAPFNGAGGGGCGSTYGNASTGGVGGDGWVMLMWSA